MINNTVLMGRLVATPELKSTQSGIAVTSFTIAVERSYAKQGEQRQRQADFIDCVAWKGTAEFIARYFQKGSMISVVGEIQTRTYEDKEGNKRKAVEVLIKQASFCGSKSESGTGASSANASQTSPSFTADNSDFEEIPEDDDLPF